MKALKVFGFFRELSSKAAAPLPSIFEHVAPQPLPDQDQVVQYLDSGYVLFDMMDHAKDVFDENRDIINGASVLTDGAWFWRKDSGYYVKNHNIELPEEFLVHIRSHRYRVPRQDEEALKAYTQEARGTFFKGSV